jgi:hypothetical protein
MMKHHFIYLEVKLDECVKDYFWTMCQDHVSIRPTLNCIWPEYKLFLFMYEIKVYDKNIILFILKSNWMSLMKIICKHFGWPYIMPWPEYQFQFKILCNWSMCRDYVSILVNNKLYHGQSINVPVFGSAFIRHFFCHLQINFIFEMLFDGKH